MHISIRNFILIPLAGLLLLTVGCSGQVFRRSVDEPGYGVRNNAVGFDQSGVDVNGAVALKYGEVPLQAQRQPLRPRSDAFGGPIAVAPAPKPDNKPIAVIKFKCGETTLTAAHLKQITAVVAAQKVKAGQQWKLKPYASEIAPEKVNWGVAGLRGTNVKRAIVDEAMRQKKFGARAEAWQYFFVETGGEGTQVVAQAPDACADDNQVVEIYIVDATGKSEQPERAKK